MSSHNTTRSSSSSQDSSSSWPGNHSDERDLSQEELRQKAVAKRKQKRKRLSRKEKKAAQQIQESVEAIGEKIFLNEIGGFEDIDENTQQKPKGKNPRYPDGSTPVSTRSRIPVDGIQSRGSNLGSSGQSTPSQEQGGAFSASLAGGARPKGPTDSTALDTSALTFRLQSLKAVQGGGFDQGHLTRDSLKALSGSSTPRAIKSPSTHSPAVSPKKEAKVNIMTPELGSGKPGAGGISPGDSPPGGNLPVAPPPFAQNPFDDPAYLQKWVNFAKKEAEDVETELHGIEAAIALAEAETAKDEENQSKKKLRSHKVVLMTWDKNLDRQLGTLAGYDNPELRTYVRPVERKINSLKLRIGPLIEEIQVCIESIEIQARAVLGQAFGQAGVPVVLQNAAADKDDHQMSKINLPDLSTDVLQYMSTKTEWQRVADANGMKTPGRWTRLKMQIFKNKDLLEIVGTEYVNKLSYHELWRRLDSKLSDPLAITLESARRSFTTELPSTDLESGVKYFRAMDNNHELMKKEHLTLEQVMVLYTLERLPKSLLDPLKQELDYNRSDYKLTFPDVEAIIEKKFKREKEQQKITGGTSMMAASAIVEHQPQSTSLTQSPWSQTPQAPTGFGRGRGKRKGRGSGAVGGNGGGSGVPVTDGNNNRTGPGNIFCQYCDKRGNHLKEDCTKYKWGRATRFRLMELGKCPCCGRKETEHGAECDHRARCRTCHGKHLWNTCSNGFHPGRSQSWMEYNQQTGSQPVIPAQVSAIQPLQTFNMGVQAVQGHDPQDIPRYGTYPMSGMGTPNYSQTYAVPSSQAAGGISSVAASGVVTYTPQANQNFYSGVPLGGRKNPANQVGAIYQS